MKDKKVMKHIEKLTSEEEQLYSKGNLTEKEMERLNHLKIELDQYWDFLRQRRAFRDAGSNVAKASIRPAEIVEHYKR